MIWWEANEKDFEQFYLLEVHLDEDRPEVIRIACLSSLEMVLERRRAETTAAPRTGWNRSTNTWRPCGKLSGERPGHRQRR